MTEFTVELRHRCRNHCCRSNLPHPVEIAQRAFCCRGCHSQFYRRRCVVCESELPPGPANRKLCRKAKCRAVYRKFQHLYKWPESMRTAHHSQNGERPPKSVDSTGTKISHPDDRLRRSDLIRNAQQTEFYGGGQWREVVSPDGVRCFVTRLWGKDPEPKLAT
jgi:hypothetical protein